MRAVGDISPTFLAAHVAAPLLLGGLIYLGFRTTELLVFAWIEALGALPALLWLRAVLEPTGATLPTWVVHSLPDGLWVYAVTAFMLRLWRGAPARARLPWAALGALSGLGWEGCQWLALVPGTFDVVDVACMAAMTAIAFALHYPQVQARRTEAFAS